MSRRTLTRRLGEEGTSFRAILDDVRAELSRALLQDRKFEYRRRRVLPAGPEPAAFHRIVPALDRPDTAIYRSS